MCKYVCYNVDRQNDRMCSYAAQRKATEFLPPGLFKSRKGKKVLANSKKVCYSKKL